MRFHPDKFYFLHNRGFDGHILFPTPGYYTYFKERLNIIRPFASILAYNLDPTHFELLIHVPEASTGLELISSRSPLAQQKLTRRIGGMLSSYARALNKSENRIGSLFLPKTKSIELDVDNAFACFHYIHQHPLTTHRATRMEDWNNSSFNEYFKGLRGPCDREMAYLKLGVSRSGKDFRKEAYSVMRDTPFALERETA